MAKCGPEPHPTLHARIVAALERGTKCKWDTYEPYAVMREPGSGRALIVAPWHVEAAYREIAGRALVTTSVTTCNTDCNDGAV